MKNNYCSNCGEELYANRCLNCNPKPSDNPLPNDYTPGDPFW